MENKNVTTISRESFLEIKKNLEGKKRAFGGFSCVYFFNNKAYKVYNKKPHLVDNNGVIVFDHNDVLENILYFGQKKFDMISDIKKVYLVDENIVMYEMEDLSYMYNMRKINENNFDITLEELKLTWKSALKLAFELSNKNRIMYDLKESNAFILNGNFKVCDVDFYMKENLDNILNINYKLVNTTFIDFIERYLFSYCYECRYDKHLIETESYVDDAIEHLLLNSNPSSKTLRQVAKNLR